MSEQVDLLVRMEAQGASASTTQSADASLQPDPNDATQVCEIRASSPFDPNRTRGLPVDFLQQLSLATLSGEVDTKTVQAQLKSIKDVCEKVLQERPKVARFSYLTGRVYQAIASISTGLDQQQALAASSAYFQQAADLGLFGSLQRPRFVA